VQADHPRVAAQELLQGPKLRFATDERNAAPLGDRRGDNRSITARTPRCKGGSDALDDRDLAWIPSMSGWLSGVVVATTAVLDPVLGQPDTVRPLVNAVALSVPSVSVPAAALGALGLQQGVLARQPLHAPHRRLRRALRPTKGSPIAPRAR
jgi:hypothetical protein